MVIASAYSWSASSALAACAPLLRTFAAIGARAGGLAGPRVAPRRDTRYAKPVVNGAGRRYPRPDVFGQGSSTMHAPVSYGSTGIGFMDGEYMPVADMRLPVTD